MPRTKRSAAASKPTYKDIGRILGANTGLAETEEEEEYHLPPPSFGTRDGGYCHCARCLKRSGPLTDDPG